MCATSSGEAPFGGFGSSPEGYGSAALEGKGRRAIWVRRRANSRPPWPGSIIGRVNGGHTFHEAAAGSVRSSANPISVPSSVCRPSTERLRWRLPDPGRMLGDLVDADEGVDPPLLRFLVDLTLAHDEARVQPAVAVVLSQQFEPRDDRAPRPRPLLDALPVDGQKDVGVVLGPNDAAQVRRPHTVLSPARGIGPPDGSLEHVARDHPIARAEPRPLQSAERSGPRSIGVPHRQLDKTFESHG